VPTKGGTVVAEYDVPADAWYFEAAKSTAVPLSVLIEILLQPCGWLAAYLGSALTSSTDLSFRNLGGTATQYAEVGAQIASFKSTQIAAVGTDAISSISGAGVDHDLQDASDITHVEDITIEDDGSVYISSISSEAVALAKLEVEGLTAEAEVGKIYKGKVTRIMGIGVFVEIFPGKEGLIRMNQLSDKFVEKAEDFCKEGEEMEVKVLEVDMQGRINLSRKAVTHPGSENVGRDAVGGPRGGGRDFRRAAWSAARDLGAVHQAVAGLGRHRHEFPGGQAGLRHSGRP